jgi:hypothetical protein
MSKNGHNGHGHVTETPDVSHIRNVDVTHETSDVNVGGILKFVVGLTILGIMVNVLMYGMFRFFNSQEIAKEPGQGPMAMSKDERLPPEPRLQAAPGFGVKLTSGHQVDLSLKEPEAEYRVLREQWVHQLYCKEGPESHEAAVTKHPCMPIDEAIEKLFTGAGLPVRAAEKESGKSSELALPTAASSGRATGFK